MDPRLRGLRVAAQAAEAVLHLGRHGLGLGHRLGGGSFLLGALDVGGSWSISRWRSMTPWVRESGA